MKGMRGFLPRIPLRYFQSDPAASRHDIDNEILSNFGFLLGARRTMRALFDPPISCSSSTDPSYVAVLTKSGIRKGFVSPSFLG